MINVIGLGYIGLPTALMFASHGAEVVGTDINASLVDTLNAGRTTFEEKGLDALHHREGLVAPFEADEGGHVAAGAMLGLEGTVVFPDDHFRDIADHRLIAPNIRVCRK